jgi:hypothetical protein
MKQRNSVSKALSGTILGQQKEMFVMTYKAIWSSVGEYAVLVWGNTAKPTIAENEALRMATGA